MNQSNETTAKTSGMSRRLRAVLFGSLALNMIVVGIVGGGILAGRGAPNPLGGYEMTLGPFTEALDGADRDILRDRMRNRADLRRPDHADRDAALRDFLAAVTSDPFDPAAVQAIFDDQRTRATSGLVAGQELLLERLSAMTPQARQDFADRLGRRLSRNH